MGIGQTRVEGSSIWGNGTSYVYVSPECRDATFPTWKQRKLLLTGPGKITVPCICQVMGADISPSADVRNVLETAMRAYSHRDVPVNNIGITRLGVLAIIAEELQYENPD
jgi:NAD(P)-dependent dehydrogenase (short-subunit alcohol dehydrogenase family)